MVAFCFWVGSAVGYCAIFIDGGYLTKVLENEFSRPFLDYQKLSNVLAGTNQRLRTYYYDCMPYQGNPPTVEQSQKHSAKSRFIHSLTRGVQRFQFRQGRLRRTASGQFEQKRIDVLLAIDMVRLSSKKQIDTVVLIAGDSDLVPAVEASKEEGAIVRLYYSPRSVSDELLNVCDERYLINQSFINSALDRPLEPGG
jgi:uncharacterized LabA/DUF88 family protein